MVIFSDFQCSYCQKAAESLKTEILPKAGDHVQLVFRHLPLTGHDWARIAAETTACVFEQGNDKFWSLHDFIFANQTALSAANVAERMIEHARSLTGFNESSFRMCIADGTGKRLVDADIALANQIGISGTPAIFVNGQQSSSQTNHILAAIERGVKESAASNTSLR